jgi:hypothetical protein
LIALTVMEDEATGAAPVLNPPHQVAFYASAGIALVGALACALLVTKQPRTLVEARRSRSTGGVHAGDLALAAMSSEHFAPQMMRPIGITQSNRMLVGFLSIAPASTWKGTIAVNTQATSSSAGGWSL